MSNFAIGMTCLAICVTLIGARVPIGLALGGISLLGLILIRGPEAALRVFGSLPVEFGASWTLSAIPLFLLMGSIAFNSGQTDGLFKAARLWLSWLPGGLAVATNFASAGFAAASGSSLATSAAMGRMAIPEMLKYKYDPALATGAVAAAGTLGALIPPSIMFVIYGWYTGTPIGALLLAGAIPGVLTAVIYFVMIVLRCMANPSLGPRILDKVTWSARMMVLLEVWPIPLLMMAVIVSIYTGWATATEAAAIGAMAAALIALFQGRLTVDVIKRSVTEALVSSASIFFVVIGAMLLTRLLAFAGVPSVLQGWVVVLGLDPITIILGVIVLYLVMGMFLDGMGTILLTIPVLQPIFEAADINPIWIGVLLVKMLEIGMLTPPVGMNVYVVKGVVGDTIPITTIFRGVLWFLVAEVVIMGLLVAFPQISLWLPATMGK